LSSKAVHLIAAARPNFMKVAPLHHALALERWRVPRIVHTGQHYDANMSDAFLVAAAREALAGRWPKGRKPPL
jgi:UDP-N-acetylglucosamine 2-epimerase